MSDRNGPPPDYPPRREPSPDRIIKEGGYVWSRPDPTMSTPEQGRPGGPQPQPQSQQSAPPPPPPDSDE